MKWPKDRKRAFLWAAKAFGTPYEDRTEEQKELTSKGFCFTITALTGSTEIYYWGETFFGVDTHWWSRRGDESWTPDCDNERSLFCSLMAELSDKEFEELGA
jgi:hypothetical protein